MTRGKSLILVLGVLLLGTGVAHAQYTAKEWPEGPSKQRFTDTCGGCHDINRVRIGYTPEGWLTVVRMMQNMNAPVPAEEWGAMTEYLMKSFPERKRPEAVIIDGPVKAQIKSPRKGRVRTIPLPHGTARSGGALNSPTSSAGSIRKPERRRNIRSNRHSPVLMGLSRTRAAIFGSLGISQG
jgi:hypothetical protein